MMIPDVAGPSTKASTQEHTVLLEVKHLNVDYETGSERSVHAVNDVSFTLHRGQILGLAGESGSGKSTLAYAITRLLHPPAVITGGEILYYLRDEQSEPGDAIDILQLSKKQLRAFRWQELAIVFQSAMNALNPGDAPRNANRGCIGGA